jgi:hypothetical protein
MTPLIAEMSKLVAEPETAHWFDLGMIDEHVPAAHIEWDKCRRMPYPRTCCVFTTPETGTKYAVFLAPGENSVAVGYVAKDDGGPPIHSRIISIIEVNGELVYRVGDKEPENEGAVKNVARVLVVVAQRIHAERTAYRPEPIGTPAQQAKRKRHGKAPLFTWHTVQIKPPVIEQPAIGSGGTHASPRLHDRRGHYRNLKSGKRVWVRDCKVGDASRGVIFKDYEVRQ